MIVFIAFVEVRKNYVYSDKGEILKKIHFVHAENRDEAINKVNKFYRDKCIQYDVNYDVTEITISEEEIIT